MDQGTRKLMTMHETLLARDDVDRLYVSKKVGRRELVSIEYRVEPSILRLVDYIEKLRGRLISATRNNTDDMRISGMEITREQKLEEKQVCGHFKRLTSDNSHEKTRT